ncbi:hypothetical protein [Krasilnikovia sp. MM14-A1259]|uniref:hypothetical protein n=1 Tax=Krasilnikovia sp. MM14-A1259 TaxID=3373539 RepID=UPI0037F3C300
MTTESVPAGGDPHRLLSDVHTLTRQVRLDRRVTWAALLVLGAATLFGIPFDWFGMMVHCHADGGCEFARRGVLYYWPWALPAAYAIIAMLYARVARQRGLGARVLPYAITGALTTLLFTAAWVAAALYLPGHPPPFNPLPYWWFVLDRLVSPWGLIGVALLVLAWLERHLALLAFGLGYLALVLFVLPMGDGFASPLFGIRAGMALPQLIVGVVLLLSAAGFARAARRRQR